MLEILRDKIVECKMMVNFFEQIIGADCAELRERVVRDLGYGSLEQLELNWLFVGDAREIYLKLNSPQAETRNYLILQGLQSKM